MRAIVLAGFAALIAAPAAAQSVDPATQALNTQIAIEAENARRAQAEAQREADVARQRLETEQRIQALETQQAARRLSDLQSRTPPPSAPRWSGPASGALQSGKPAAKVAA